MLVQCNRVVCCTSAEKEGNKLEGALEKGSLFLQKSFFFFFYKKDVCGDSSGCCSHALLPPVSHVSAPSEKPWVSHALLPRVVSPSMPAPALCCLAAWQLLAQDPNATIIEEVDAENFAINLGFTPEGWLSRLFGGMSYVLFKVVSATQICTFCPCGKQQGQFKWLSPLELETSGESCREL